MALPGFLKRLRQRTEVWLSEHLRAFVTALGQLHRNPLPSLMTAGVIGISLALPGGFMLLLDNLRSVAGDWQGSSAQLSAFIEPAAAESDYRGLAEDMRKRQDVAAVEVITPDQALAEFRELSDFDEALNLLGDNPLPAVVVVRPLANLSPADIDLLYTQLKARPEVDAVRLDREWVQRLYAIMRLAQRGVQVVAVLLGLAVILVVGNTIRLDIENRRDEIQITKLIGGTDAFIRRPFLYEGVWYGLLGGVLALILLGIGGGLLSGPATQLARLYNSAFRLDGLDFSQGLLVLGAGILLGLLGSWMAVGRHLSAIEPQ